MQKIAYFFLNHSKRRKKSYFLNFGECRKTVDIHVEPGGRAPEGKALSPFVLPQAPVGRLSGLP
jgi:hypothetical protein